MRRKEWLHNKIFTMRDVGVCRLAEDSQFYKKDVFKIEGLRIISNFEMLQGPIKVKQSVQALQKLIEESIEEFDRKKKLNYKTYKYFGVANIDVAVQDNPIQLNRTFFMKVSGLWLVKSQYEEITKTYNQPRTNLEHYLYINARELFAKELIKIPN